MSKKTNNYLTMQDCIDKANNVDKTFDEQVDDIKKSFEYHQGEYTDRLEMAEDYGIDYDLVKISKALSKGISEARVFKKHGVKKADKDFVLGFHKHYSKCCVAEAKLEMLGQK